MFPRGSLTQIFFILCFLWLFYSNNKTCTLFSKGIKYHLDVQKKVILMSITTFWWEVHKVLILFNRFNKILPTRCACFRLNQECLFNVSLLQILLSHSSLCFKWLRVSNILGFYWTKSPLDFCRKMPVSSAAVMWSDNTYCLCWVVKIFVLCSVATFRFVQVWSCSIPRWLLLVRTIVSWESAIPSTLLFICFYLLSHTNTVTTH